MAHRKRAFNTVRGKAWQAMRILRVFTLPQLQAVCEMKRDNAIVFVHRLRRAGYLTTRSPSSRGTPGVCAMYRLVRDSGPLCPILWNDGRVFDRNLQYPFDADGTTAERFPLA